MSVRRALVTIVLVAACSGKTGAPGGDAGAGPGADGSSGTESDTPFTGVLALAPGEVAEVIVNGDGVAAARLATPTGGERFVAILGSTHIGSAASVYEYSIAVTPGTTPTGSRAATGCSLDAERFRGAPIAAETEPAGPATAVGATRTIQVSVDGAAQAINARAIAVSARAVVWVDVTPAHPATLDAAFVNSLLADFDKAIVPRARGVFGMESDLDGDGRIGLVFTPLTKDVAVAFFNGCDLASQAGCGAANRGELLYLTPPADIAPPYNTPAAIKEIVAHELGHLVHFNRKVLRNKLLDWPDSAYMIEGFGAFAQDVLGYQSGNLYVTKAGLEQLGEFSVADVLGTRQRYDAARDGLLRGVSYLLVRWMYDRAGGDSAHGDGTLESRGGPALLRALFDGPRSVAAGLPAQGKGSLADMTMDFYTTLAMSNGDKKGNASPVNPCFAFLPVAADPVTQKPRGADIHASFHGTQKMPGAPVQAAAAADGKLRAGGVEYLALTSVTGEAELGVTLRVDPASAARVRVARLK